MFADEDGESDMFAKTPLKPNALQAVAESHASKGLLDNWDDADGYYKFKVPAQPPASLFIPCSLSCFAVLPFSSHGLLIFFGKRVTTRWHGGFRVNGYGRVALLHCRCLLCPRACSHLYLFMPLPIPRQDRYGTSSWAVTNDGFIVARMQMRSCCHAADLHVERH